MSTRRRPPAPMTARPRPSVAALPPNRAVRARVRDWLVERSAYLYGPGDMRRAYRWTREALRALLLAAVLVVAWRLAATTAFVTHVSTDPPLVAAFNLSLTTAAAITLVGLSIARGRIRRWWRYRRAGAERPAGPL